jgi:hypothetical protein
MSTKTARQEYIEALLADGVSLETAEAISKLAKEYQRLAEVGCSYDVGTEGREKIAFRQRVLEEQLRGHIGGSITGMRFGGDPRGFTVKLFLKSGKYNSWGGVEEGYGVPTPYADGDDIVRVARQYGYKGAR